MAQLIITGECGSGKDTIADILGSEYSRFAFADELKLVCRNLRVNGVHAAFGQLRNLFEWNPPANLLRKLEELQQIPKHDEKDRRILQELGEWCRSIDSNIWIRPVRNNSHYLRNVIVTDMRKLHEFNSFPDFTSVYIDAPLPLRLERLRKRDGAVDELALKHKAESEIELLRSKCNHVVNNSGTLDELRLQVEEILKYVEVKN